MSRDSSREELIEVARQVADDRGLDPDRFVAQIERETDWLATEREIELAGDATAEREQEGAMEPMKKSIMAWQLNNTREQTVREWVDTLRLGGIDCFRVKSHQHLNWMGNVYRHPLAPAGLNEIERQYEAFLAEGIWYLPWCVPMGLNVAAEADLAIEVARRCGNRIDVDLEIGVDFWDTKRLGTRGVVDYFARLKDAGLWVMVDTAMFEGWVEALALAEIAPYVDRFLSQSYWIGFGRSYEKVIRADVAEMRRFTAGEIGIVGDVRARPEEFEAAAALAQSLGCVEMSGWSTDMATPASYDGYNRIPSRPFFVDGEEPVVLEPNQAARDGLNEQYRIVHRILFPMIPEHLQGEAYAALETYDRQLYPIKAAIGLT